MPRQYWIINMFNICMDVSYVRTLLDCDAIIEQCVECIALRVHNKEKSINNRITPNSNCIFRMPQTWLLNRTFLDGTVRVSSHRYDMHKLSPRWLDLCVYIQCGNMYIHQPCSSRTLTVRSHIIHSRRPKSYFRCARSDNRSGSATPPHIAGRSRSHVCPPL